MLLKWDAKESEHVMKWRVQEFCVGEWGWKTVDMCGITPLVDAFGYMNHEVKLPIDTPGVAFRVAGCINDADGLVWSLPTQSVTFIPSRTEEQSALYGYLPVLKSKLHLISYASLPSLQTMGMAKSVRSNRKT